jgi:hypothetical protein
MDRNGQELLQFGKKLLVELRALSTALIEVQKQVSSLRDQQEAANRDQQAQRQDPQILNAELQIPEDVKREKRASDVRQYSLQILLVIGTWLAFLAAAVYAGIANSQLQQMKKSVRINHDSLTSVQRAFVAFKTFTNTTIPSNKQGQPATWLIEAVWENSGPTPAIVLGQHFSINKLSAEPDEEKFKGKTGENQLLGSAIGPRATLNAGPIVIPESLVIPSDRNNISGVVEVNSEQAVFFSGWIAYRDVFPQSETHVSEFCSYIQAVVFGKNLQTGATMQVKTAGCSKHNCIDKNCDDYDEILAFIPK